MMAKNNQDITTDKHTSESYKNGSEMWRDNAMTYGIDEAIVICRNYLDMNLKREHSKDEGQFCRELFSAMYRATADRAVPKNIIYSYNRQIAHERTESSYFHASRELNMKCANGINTLIADSGYKVNFYNLEIAAMRAIQEYGFQRVCTVLAFNYQKRSRDGQFSAINKEWANGFVVPEDGFYGIYLQAHPILIDAFCDYVRVLYQELGAERFALPGNEESGEFVGGYGDEDDDCEHFGGYGIKRAIITTHGHLDSEGLTTGYAIGHNPDAVAPWVCWQFAVREGKRVYNNGIYGIDEQDAIDAYNARVFVALNRER